jgi:trans-aconitate methyltransferase
VNHPILIPPRLLSDAQLELSAVVANNRMNRERALFGINSYQKELGIDLLGLLAKRCDVGEEVRWIDVCCGTGNALLQAAAVLHARASWPQLYLEGLDLVGMFSPQPSHYGHHLQMQIGSVSDWQPQTDYDLVTCIHGVHYLGDKLGFIRKVLAHLKPDGLFVFNLDVHNFKDADGQSMEAWWR